MFVVTNRELHAGRTGLAQFGKRPTPAGPNDLRMVEVRRVSKRWRVQIIPDVLDADWRRRAGLSDASLEAMGFDPAGNVYGSMYVARKVLDRVNPPRTGSSRRKGRNLLVYVHGYNNDLDDVVTRAAGFERNFGVEVIAFSWPANGGGLAGVASYLSDKNDAKVSVGALDRTLAKVGDMLTRFNEAWIQSIRDEALRKHPDNPERRDAMVSRLAEKGCPFKVNLLLHSMGNYIYKHVLLSSASVGTKLTFDNVILAAADTNNRDHADWTDRIRARSRVFVTINEDDGALLASRLKGGEEQLARLGHYPYDLNSTRVAYVDFTRVPRVGDAHAYFEGKPLEDPGVRRFFREACNGRRAETPLPFDVARNLYRFR